MAVSLAPVRQAESAAAAFPKRSLCSCIVTASAAGVFRPGAYSLQFLVFLAVIIAHHPLRLMGAGIAMSVVAAIALCSPSAFAPFDPATRIPDAALFLGCAAW